MKEYAKAVEVRYRKARRKEKGRLLDDFTRVTGYHRKSAVRLLSGRSKAASPSRSPMGRTGKRRGRPPEYGIEVKEALRVAWEATDRLCGKRLGPFLPELIGRLLEHGELKVSQEVAEQLCRLSASTIDRHLRPYKDTGGRRPFSTTKPGSLLKAAIPIRTFAEWNEDKPGFIEVDLVAHCGETTEGFYLNTLSTVDIRLRRTGWVECQAVWGKGQDRVGGAVHHVAQSLPFPLLGLDSDNGGEFINHHLYAYCQRREITFTRSRPYRKNDNAHVEQKNWSVVRRLVGYDRYSSKEALDQLQRVYRLVRLYTNFFQPLMKLSHPPEADHGAKVHKIYDTARTPYRRLLERNVLNLKQKDALQRQYKTINPVRLKARIDQALQVLWNLAD